jgi:hypothetical protein
VKYLYPTLTGLLLSLTSLVAPLLMLLALPFIKWDDEPSTARDGSTTIRGDLPNWLTWLSTPDERLPGGLYVAALNDVLAKHGKHIASWYWLGIRNRMFGLRMVFGKPATEYIPDVRGWYQNGDIWQYSKQVGIFRFAVGYKVYKLLDGSFLAGPVCTVMVRR